MDDAALSDIGLTRDQADAFHVDEFGEDDSPNRPSAAYGERARKGGLVPGCMRATA
jgi:hypothetical protein